MSCWKEAHGLQGPMGRVQRTEGNSKEGSERNAGNQRRRTGSVGLVSGLDLAKGRIGSLKMPPGKPLKLQSHEEKHLSRMAENCKTMTQA